MFRGTTHWILVILSVGLACAAGFFFYEKVQLQSKLANLIEQEQQTVADLTRQLDAATQTITEQKQTIETLEADLEATKDELRDTERALDNFEREYRDAINTVRNLDKLSQIDEELLRQYSRVSFLNENYVPKRLVEIDKKWLDATKTDEYFLADAWPFLKDLLKDAARDGVELRVLSAYRSFDEQAQLKGQYLVTYGEGANTFSADQGFSEHQLGTAVDFTTPEQPGQLQGFEKTEAYTWLLDNAYKHGFILSYPEGNDFYVFEPWHWRFVGEDLARDLRRDKRTFYEVPQRELDTYRLNLFD